MTPNVAILDVETVENLGVYIGPRVLGVSLQELPQQTEDTNPVFVYLSSLSESSRRTMGQSLDAIAGILTQGQVGSRNFPWWQLKYQHTTALRSILMERYRPATANKMIAALKGVLKECWKLNLMNSDDRMRACDIKSIKGESLPSGRMLNQGEINALIQSCCFDKTPTGCRDAAMLAVMMSGLRRSEVVKLDTTDINIDSGAITVRAGKGNKDAITFLQGGAEQYLKDWLAIRGDAPGALFNPVTQKKEVKVGHSMTDQVIMNMLLKRAKLAGVRDVSPHDFRRTFISNLFDAGIDSSTVQGLARHSNFATTQRYDRRGDVAKQKAAAQLYIPYFGNNK
ncbi:MAG: tyrosine-type recombinase/integrase [Rhizonema sp. PD37]|nr:tyrosine-type recombinase/integrase [Rhizonema sp. PD37]